MKILCVEINKKIFLYDSLFEFINSIEDTIFINSMDIIRLNNDLQLIKEKVELNAIYNNQKITIYLKYIDITNNGIKDSFNSANKFFEM